MAQNMVDKTGKWVAWIIGSLIGLLLMAVLAHTALNFVYDAEKKAARQKVSELFEPHIIEIDSINEVQKRVPDEFKDSERLDVELQLAKKELDMRMMQMDHAKKAEDRVRERYAWARDFLQNY